MRFDPDKHYGVLGVTGSGKTVLMQAAYVHEPRAIIYDVEGRDHWERLNEITVRDIQALRDAMAEGYNKIHFYAPTQTKENDMRTFNTICELVFKTERFRLFCDELANVTDRENIPEWCEILLSRGRKRWATLFWATQRLQLISKTVLTQSDGGLFMFRMNDYDALQLKRNYGLPDFRARLGRMRPYQFMYYQAGRQPVECRPINRRAAGVPT